jgi:hypothetical protein
MNKQKLLLAAVAGITLGVTAPRDGAAGAGEKADEVKCYGINACGSHAKCSVTAEDLAAVKALLGAKEYAKRFGKSEVHACGSHAKCGASAQILNWVDTSGGECRAQGGLLIEEVNGKKVARKA